MANKQLFFNQATDPAQTSPALVSGQQLWFDSNNPDFLRWRKTDNSAWVDLNGGKISISAIINTLTETGTGKVLDARQGKVLKDLIDSLTATVSGKQATLVSGTNLKTLNGNSLLGSGNIDVSGGGTGSAVSSVNTRTGAVVLAKSDVGLSNADNTADASKPVSTAQAAANTAATNAAISTIRNGVTSDGDDLAKLLVKINAVSGGTSGTSVSSYTYIAYADDEAGTGFTNNFSPLKDYIAVKTTTSPIAAPTAATFAGLWKNYKGEPGIQGPQGPAGSGGTGGGSSVETVIVSETELQSLITTATANTTTDYSVIVNAEIGITAFRVIPANIYFKRVNNGKFTRANAAGKIHFNGFGLLDPQSERPMFSGFQNGDVQWVGAVYPRVISSNLWLAGGSASERLMRAVASITNKFVRIEVYPGTFTGDGLITAKKEINFNRGYYPNTYGGNPSGNQFIVEDDCLIKGAGIGQTVFQESPSNCRLFYASGVVNYPYDGANKNIFFRDFTVEGNPACAYDSASSTLFLGNVKNGSVTFVHFKDTHGFGVYCGGFSDSGHWAENVWITDNIFEGLGTQNAGTIGGNNLHISRNIFKANPKLGASYVAVIDIEPNAHTKGCPGIHIQDNIIDGKLAQSGWHGITLQKGYSDGTSEVVVSGNSIIGVFAQPVVFLGEDVIPANDTVKIPSHGLETGYWVDIAIDNNGNGGPLPGGLGITGTGNVERWIIRVDNNNIKLATNYNNAINGVAVDITEAGATGVLYSITPHSKLGSGIQVWEIDNVKISDNMITGSNLSALDVQSATNLDVSNNHTIGCGSFGVLYDIADSVIRDNTAQFSKHPLGSSTNIFEIDQSRRVSTVAGSKVVTVNADQNLVWWHRGKQIIIDGQTYTIKARVGMKWILTEPFPTTLTNVVAKVIWSSNKYINNELNGGKTQLSDVGTSTIVALGAPIRKIITGTTYTLRRGDYGMILDFTSATPVVLTFPTGLGTDFYCAVQTDGDGIVTPTAATGVTLVNPYNHTKSLKNGKITIDADAKVANKFYFQGATQA